MSSDGITCPYCKSERIGVIDSRPKAGGKRVRRYACEDCERRFNTVEINSSVFDLLIKNWKERKSEANDG